MKICSLSSGSKGNSIYIESQHSRILLDIGLSALQIRKRLESIKVEPESLDAIVLTHAHADHVRGVGVFARKFKTPVYGHEETLQSIAHYFNFHEKSVPWRNVFKINDLTFTPFEVSHDAFPTYGYIISDIYQKLILCTDLGVVTGRVIEHVAQADILIIESNHDPQMLATGPYPWELKERILSRVGHLSNHQTGLLIKNVLHSKIKKIFLAHLSEENNTPELALNTNLEYVGQNHTDLFTVFQQRTVSPVFEF